ncbi:MAG: hypothetical protein Aurels2KO_38410 [Aureliella sp.]
MLLSPPIPQHNFLHSERESQFASSSKMKSEKEVGAGAMAKHLVVAVCHAIAYHPRWYPESHFSQRNAIMLRLAVGILLSCGLASTPVVAQENLLRVDTVLSEISPEPGKKPKTKTLRSVEVIAQPGGKFFAKTTDQGTNYVLSGRLRVDQRGQMTAELTYRYDAAQPVRLAAASSPHTAGSTVSTTLPAVVGKSIMISGTYMMTNGKAAQMKKDLYFTVSRFDDRSLR